MLARALKSGITLGHIADAGDDVVDGFGEFRRELVVGGIAHRFGS